MRLNILSLIIVLLLSVSSNSWADEEKESLLRGIKYCTIAVEACKIQHHHSEELHKTKDDALKYLNDDNAKLRARKNAWYKNGWLMIAIGVLAGAAATR